MTTSRHPHRGAIPVPAGRAPRFAYARYVWRALLVVAVSVGGLFAAVHGVAGVSWSQVSGLLAGVAPTQLLVLSAVWLGGLAIYATVLAGALPGLGLRRGLVLNLSGSAVANVVPLGGAVATAVNWRMVRAWGHSDRSFVTFCVLTNGLDVMTKLLLPMVAVAALLFLSVQVPTWLWLVTLAGVTASVALGLVPVLVTRPARADHQGRASWQATVRRHLRGSGEQVRDLVTRRWLSLLPGSAAYAAAQVLLLAVALWSVGLHPTVGTILVAAAVERLGALVPITPGGVGVAEVGTVAWLVAAGLDPASSVAGVLLYRVFLVLLEIPLGGVLLGGWWWLHRGPRTGWAGQAAT